MVPGLFVLGKSRHLANSKPPVIKYRRPAYGAPKKKFRKKKGQFTFRSGLEYYMKNFLY